MRRQILRFPVNRQFREILNDDHEWFVLTDLHLRTLIARRGSPHHVPDEVVASAYNELFTRLKTNRPVGIYELHTHPYDVENEPDCGQDLIPSIGDINYFSNDRILNAYRDKVIKYGYGIITKRGILIIKLPTIKSKYHRALSEFPKKFERDVESSIDNTIDKRKRELGKTPYSEISKICHDASQNTFKSLVSSTKGVTTRTVRRTHARTARTRR